LGQLFTEANEFEAVVIATGGDHVVEVRTAVEAGKHVFVEKPLALTPQQATPLVDAVETAGVSCVVGYMKRYSPAVTTALRQVPQPRCARADLIHPPEDAYLRVAGTSRPVGGSLLEFARSQVTDGPSAAAIRACVGADASQTALVGYFLLATSVIHDVNLLRAALGGGNVRVVSAAVWNDGLSGQAILRGRSGCVGVLTYVFVATGRYTETVSLVGDHTRCAVSFPSPYLPHAPIALTIENGAAVAGGEAVAGELVYDDVFAAELAAFHEHIAAGSNVATGPREALADLELIAAIARSAHLLDRDTTTVGNRRADFG
jgi:predicted dehydrogenase